MLCTVQVVLHMVADGSPRAGGYMYINPLPKFYIILGLLLPVLQVVLAWCLFGRK